MNYLPDLTIEEKVNMSLDEIINYEHKQEISYLKEKLLIQKDLINNLNNMKYKVNTIDEWMIHINQYGEEYVSGYHRVKNKYWETSSIKDKIPLSEYLLIVTENETLYRLPYYSVY